MATVPGPGHDRPLPRPGAPAEEPMADPGREPDEEREASPAEPDHPAWEPEPWSPEREVVEPGAPVGVP